MNITNEAKLKLEAIFQEQGAKGIRFYSNGAGCCGPQVGLSLEEPQDTDIIQEINGVRVALDQELEGSVKELTLDNDETPEGSQFVLLGMNQSC
ncbi:MULTISPECIES: adhesin [unclassified Oceanobacillus]|uniref:HesB/IscA family protein n=1 Tax=unclassified Oceanobacillus TaxID=2630292 RepID=UPI001BEA3E15|nr:MULTISPECIES: adhesin [unclassified Oceanobacillus]MBT2601118.1 adhesin [Oceanobacillus sp. ISL-74]MBT2652344.1 adhesin [Oceanobacillus sp. ISL-73]